MYLPRSVAARVMITDIDGTQRGAAARLGGGGYDRILGRRHTCASLMQKSSTWTDNTSCREYNSTNLQIQPTVMSRCQVYSLSSHLFCHVLSRAGLWR